MDSFIFFMYYIAAWVPWKLIIMKKYLCMRLSLSPLLYIIFSQVSDLIGKIQKAYVETLEELSWMDSPSKEKAREKVQYILEQRF